MPLTIKHSPHGLVHTIHVERCFDFSLHADFREAYRHLAGAGHSIGVNLSRTEYMHSSALGMLLLLKEHAASLPARVSLQAVPATVLRILEIASFDKIFVIEE